MSDWTRDSAGNVVAFPLRRFDAIVVDENKLALKIDYLGDEDRSGASGMFVELSMTKQTAIDLVLKILETIEIIDQSRPI